MEPERWLRSWAEGRIGFHRPDVNPDLPRFEAQFLAGGPHRVLVPLAGKSVDLVWLARRGHQVTAVELSPLAARDFHAEQGLAPELTTEGTHQVWRSPNLRFIVGDLFALPPAEVHFTRIWDRAAMVALDPPRRARYLATLQRLAPGARILLNVLEYDPARMEGPPHSISAAEVAAAYPDAALLHTADGGAPPGAPPWTTRTYLGHVPG